MRRFTPVELALGFAVLGSVVAVAIPTFARELHGSRFVEPEGGLQRIGEAAVAYATLYGRFPDSAPMTPAAPPRGKREADPAGTWDSPAWRTLDFRPAAEGVPHAYAFQFESFGDRFVARARGDLDGDGVLSTFELRGTMKPGEPPRGEPGMYVEAELE